jgi:uncharacterized protein
MLTISQLFIFPVKSLSGISVSTSEVTNRGLKFDRRWMIVDKNNQFLTLREYPKMALLDVEITEEGLTIKSRENSEIPLKIPFITKTNTLENVTIWNATVQAKPVKNEADMWLSYMLDGDCKLVYMPDESMRPVDTTSGYHPKGKFTSFSDAYPFLLLGEASMEDLNARSEKQFSIQRFRPNIVFSGGSSYQEDNFENFTINNVNFTGLENCARCKIPNVNPETGILDADNEPLKTLSKYRLRNKNLEFGRNIVHDGTGIISIGDELKLK